MLNINRIRILSDNCTCKVLSGLSCHAFNKRVPVFKNALYVIRKKKPNRKRTVGAGQRGKLPTTTHQLACVLIYLKTYLTFDLLVVLMNRARSKCCESAKFLLPTLERAPGKVCVLPKRQIKSLAEFHQHFGDFRNNSNRFP